MKSKKLYFSQLETRDETRHLYYDCFNGLQFTRAKVRRRRRQRRHDVGVLAPFFIRLVLVGLDGWNA